MLVQQDSTFEMEGMWWMWHISPFRYFTWCLFDKGRKPPFTLSSRPHTAFSSVPLNVPGRPDTAMVTDFAALTKRLQLPLPMRISTPRSRWRSYPRRREWTDSGTRSSSTRPRGCCGCLGVTLRSTDPSTTSGINFIQNSSDDFYYQSTIFLMHELP